MKWKLLMIIILLLPLIGAVQLQYSDDNSTWENITNVDDTNNEGYQVNLQPNTLYYFRGKNETSSWNYTSQRTKIAGESIMASLGIILFVSGIALAIFILAFRTTFTDNEISNNIIKKCLIIFGLFLLSLNTTIVVTIADTTGLGVNRELFRYLWLINWTIYISMIVLFFTTVQGTLKLWKIKKHNKRMGLDDYE